MRPDVAKAIQIMNDNWYKYPGTLHLFYVIMPKYFTEEQWYTIFEDPYFKNHWAHMPEK